MSRRVRAVFVVAACLLVAAAVAWRALRTREPAGGPFRVVQRLYQPLGGAVPDPLHLARNAQTKWRAGDIRASWTRVQSGASATLRSPPFELPDNFYGVIVVREGSSSPAATALLLWSDGPTLDAAQFARNRRELAGGREHTATVLRAESLQSDDERPIHHLFLHLPEGGSAGDLVETVALVTARDLARAGPGVTRIAADGETREGFVSWTPLSYRSRVPAGAELAFAVRRTGAAGAVTVTQTIDGRESVVANVAVDGGRWTEVRAPLRAADDATLRFAAATSGEADVPVYWSVPHILARGTPAKGPNIVLYVVDALRADKLGLYGGASGAAGSSAGVSPFLDRLGAGSVVFRRAYAAASWTKPSVTTLLTSLYPATHAVGARHYGDTLPPTVRTLQGELAGRGYVTAQFSPNPFTGPVSGLDRGFDQSLTATALAEGNAFEVNAAEVHARLIPWIAAHRDDRFFAYVHVVDTHPPFDGPSDLAPERAYEQAVSAVDRELARLYEELERTGVLGQTVIAITADHGEAFGEHGQRGHGQTVYDEETRVPLIVHAPGRLKPRWIDEPVQLVDLMPTLLDLAGIAVEPETLQGRNVIAAEGAADPKPSPVVISRFTYPEDAGAAADATEMHGIVDYPWKLITVDGRASPRTASLYRLDRDPGERQDLSSAEPARTRQLQSALEAFLREQRLARQRFGQAHESARPAPAPTRDLLDQLRSLGYVR